MAVINGPFYPGADCLTTLAVTADREAWIPADSGLTILGYQVTGGSGTTSKGKLYRMSTVNAGNITTGCFATFELGTGPSSASFSLPGVQCTGGVSIDWVAGQFDLTIYYKIIP